MRRKKVCNIVVLVVLTLSYFALPCRGQNNGTCKASEPVGQKVPEYEMGRITHSAPGYPREVLIFIGLDPKHFVKEDMKALASNLRDTFPDEPRIAAIILDDNDALVETSPIHRTKEYLLARRGYYYFDRTTGEEYIQFSTGRNKPWNEIFVCLGSQTGKCNSSDSRTIDN